MNKEHAAWSILIAALILACMYMVDSMSDKLDRRGTGQFVESGGVRTERMYAASGDVESLESWAMRHREAVSRFEGDQ